MPTVAVAKGADFALAAIQKFARSFPAVVAAVACLCTSATAQSEGLAATHGQVALYETVVVAQADAPDHAQEDDAASSSVITQDRTPRSGETLPQLLSEQPGVYVTRQGGLGALATVSLRGSAANQVQVYFEGVPLASATGGGVDVGLFPTSQLGRIEVYRGQSPLAFPTSAVGGVVALSTTPVQESEGSGQFGIGSFGTEFGTLRCAYAGPSLRVAVGGSYLHSTGDFPYRNDNGTAWDPTDDTSARRQNNHLGQSDGLLRATLVLPGRRELTAVTSYVDRDQGLPVDGAIQSHEAALGTQRLISTAFYQSRDDLGPGSSLRAQVHVVVTQQRFSDPLAEIAQVPTRTNDRTSLYGTSVFAARSMSEWLRLAAFANAAYERFAPSSDTQASAPSPGTRLSIALGTEPHFSVWPLALEVIPSLRLEHTQDQIAEHSSYIPTLYTSSAPATNLLPVFRIASIQHASAELALRANLGRYRRPPSLFERYGDNGFVRGNPNLVPEAGTNADVGASYEHSGARSNVLVEGALFGASIQNLIQFYPVGHVLEPANIRARILGAELSLRVRWRAHFQFSGQATFTDARDESGNSDSQGKLLPYRPRWRAYARPELRDLVLSRHLRLGFYADADQTSGNYNNTANLGEIPPRLLFGCGANLALPSHALRLVASATNLTNSSDHDLSGYPLPGRAFFVTLEWNVSIQTSPKETHP